METAFPDLVLFGSPLKSTMAISLPNQTKIVQLWSPFLRKAAVRRYRVIWSGYPPCTFADRSVPMQSGGVALTRYVVLSTCLTVYPLLICLVKTEGEPRVHGNPLSQKTFLSTQVQQDPSLSSTKRFFVCMEGLGRESAPVRFIVAFVVSPTQT